MTQPPHEAGWTPPTWEQGQQYGQPQYGQQPYGQPPYEQQQYGQPQYGYGQPPFNPPPPDVPATSHRRRTVAIVASAVVVLLAVGGVFLLTRDSDDTSTGAASPKAGAEQLVKAAAAQDVEGVLKLVDPAEARSLRVLMSALRSKLSSSGLIAASGVPFPYLSASVDGLTTTTDLASNNVAFVTVTGGKARATVDHGKLPAGVRGNKTGKETDDSNLGSSSENVRAGFVKVGSGWFFSPTTTALEASRVANDLPSPSFSDPLPAGGGSSPEDAVRGLIKASEQKDAKAAAGYISSSELPALRYYFATFARNLDPTQTPDAEVTGLDLSTTDLSNGLKKVAVKAVTIRTPDGTATYRNGCYEVSGRRRCLTGSLGSGTLLALGGGNPFVVVEQNAGKWQVAPLATEVESVRIGLSGANINKLLREEHLFLLAPVTGKLRVGTASPVKLNDGGFAKVTLSGTAGQCVSDETDGYYVEPLGDVDYYQSGCEGFTIPRSGTVDVAVVNESREPGTINVTVRAG